MGGGGHERYIIGERTLELKIDGFVLELPVDSQEFSQPERGFLVRTYL